MSFTRSGNPILGWMERAAAKIGQHAEVPYGLEEEFTRIIADECPNMQGAEAMSPETRRLFLQDFAEALGVELVIIRSQEG